MKSIFVAALAICLSVTASESASLNIAPRAQFVYQASLRRIDPNDRNVSEHFCSGSIISDRFILTAAHCVSKPNGIRPEDLIVVTGATHVRSGGVAYEADRIIIHEEYYEAKQPLRYDIALIETKSPIELNKEVQPVQLERDWVKSGASGTTSGWNRHQDVGGAHRLIHYNVQTLGNKECNKLMDNTDANLLNENNVCASHTSDVPLGNTGSPLVINDKLVGVGSWSASNHEWRSDQFIRISVFSDWIEEHSNVRVNSINF